VQNRCSGSALVPPSISHNQCAHQHVVKYHCNLSDMDRVAAMQIIEAQDDAAAELEPDKILAAYPSRARSKKLSRLNSAPRSRLRSEG
jgi:hypothetical protein